MADITMCDNTDCDLKDKCYRFTAIPNKYRQSYFSVKVNKNKNECDYFSNNKN